jgi:hypothetical protein
MTHDSVIFRLPKFVIWSARHRSEWIIGPKPIRSNRDSRWSCRDNVVLVLILFYVFFVVLLVGCIIIAFAVVLSCQLILGSPYYLPSHLA